MTQLQALIAKLHRERQNENTQSEACLNNIEATLDAAPRSESNALFSVADACKGLQKAWKEHLLHDITKQ